MYSAAADMESAIRASVSNTVATISVFGAATAREIIHMSSVYVHNSRLAFVAQQEVCWQYLRSVLKKYKGRVSLDLSVATSNTLPR